MIALTNVSKSYRAVSGRHHVLSSVSAFFPSRESIGILGKNGAGKSTLLRILSGAETPDSGQIKREGRVSWPIGFSGGFSGALTGEENSRFIARIYGESVDRVVGFARDFAEIGEYFYMPVRTYSAGMRARLAFGLSMAIDFDTYLVDEVTAVGDKNFQAKCRYSFLMRRERASVIIVSHNIATIRSYCQRCAVLANGSLRIYDTVREAAQVYEAESDV